MTHSKHRRS